MLLQKVDGDYWIDLGEICTEGKGKWVGDLWEKKLKVGNDSETYV